MDKPRHVWTPREVQEFFRARMALCRVLACVRPLNAAKDMPRARMGYADRIQHIRACSRHLPRLWFFRPRLSTVAPYFPLTSYSSDGLQIAPYTAATGAR